MSTEHTLCTQSTEGGPVQFLLEHLHRLPRGCALDVAAGRGRNTLYLAEQGFTVHAVDRDPTALQILRETAQQRQLQHVTTALVDLEGEPVSDTVLPVHTYDVVMVFFYLFRPLFPALLLTLRPGGLLLYETFLVENYLRYQRPRQREFCLEPGELPTLVPGLQILHYDEGLRIGLDNQPQSFTARLLAQKG